MYKSIIILFLCLASYNIFGVNSFSNSSSAIIYEDFQTGTQGQQYSSALGTTTTGSVLYKAISPPSGVAGNMAITFGTTGQVTLSYPGAKWSTATVSTSNYVVNGSWYFYNTTGQAGRFYLPYMGTTDTEFGSTWWTAGIETNNKSYIWNNGTTVQNASLGVSTDGNIWIYFKEIWKSGMMKHMIFDVNGKVIWEYDMFPFTFPNGQLWAGLAGYSSNYIYWVDDWSVTKSVDLTLNGMVTGMSYKLVDANNANLISGIVNGVTPTVDTTYNPIGAGWTINPAGSLFHRRLQ